VTRIHHHQHRQIPSPSRYTATALKTSHAHTPPGVEVNHASWDSSSRKASALAARGGERDLIIISATASDPEFVLNEARFLLNPNRLNVAFSRPRKELIVIGSTTIFRLIPPDMKVFENALLWKRPMRVLTSGAARKFICHCPGVFVDQSAKPVAPVELIWRARTDKAQARS
jgi:AAA domain